METQPDLSPAAALPFGTRAPKRPSHVHAAALVTAIQPTGVIEDLPGTATPHVDTYGPTCDFEYVSKKTGYGRSAIYLRLNPKSKYFDKTFPRQFHMQGWRKVRFLVREVDAWVAAQVEAARNV